MEITVSRQQGRVPVTVLQPHGDVDASNYAELISKARELFNGGSRDFLVDLSDVPFMSSAGLVALHSIAMFLRGEQVMDPQAGWAVLKSMDRSRGSGLQTHLKLLGPREMVGETLEKAGFTQFLQVFTDSKKAVDSF
ncbi:MAG TPA: STAS domain-containing protein [Anaerolineales bacterium]|nr:STAS domain-containing protein [Anaerolineales bacterium]